MAIWRRLLLPLIDLTNLFLNWRFSVPFIVNQTASILFIMLVSRFPVSVVVPCVNALQFVFTAVTGHIIGTVRYNTRVRGDIRIIGGSTSLSDLFAYTRWFMFVTDSERIISRRSYVGAVVVSVGVLIMMISDTLQSEPSLNDLPAHAQQGGNTP